MASWGVRRVAVRQAVYVDSLYIYTHTYITNAICTNSAPTHRRPLFGAAEHRSAASATATLRLSRIHRSFGV